MGSKRDKLKRAVRKTVKWGGLVVSVVLVVVWIGSGWIGAMHVGSAGINVWVREGRFGGVILSGRKVYTRAYWEWDHSINPEFEWGFEWDPDYGGTHFYIPLWFPTLLSLLPTAAAWRADAKCLRRARVKMCPACGYDRAGLAAGVMCPECGAAAGAR